MASSANPPVTNQTAIPHVTAMDLRADDPWRMNTIIDQLWNRADKAQATASAVKTAIGGTSSGSGGTGLVVPGADQDVIYNKAGALFADSNFKWDYINKVLTLVTANILMSNNQAIRWLDTAGNGITCVWFDNSDNMNIGVHQQPTVNGQLNFWGANTGGGSPVLVACINANGLFPNTDFSNSSFLGLANHRWTSLYAGQIELDYNYVSSVAAQIAIAPQDGSSPFVFLLGPATGSAAIRLYLPNTAPSVNQVLTATGVSGNNITLGWSTGGTGLTDPLNNNQMIHWKDRDGNSIAMIWMDTFNNANIGCGNRPMQGGVPTNGQLNFWAASNGIAQAIVCSVTPNGLSPFNDFGNSSFLGDASHRWTLLNVGVIDMWYNSVSSAAPSITIDPQNGSGNPVKILGPATGNQAVALFLPNTLPTAGQKLTASSVSGNNVTLGWS